jgi:hypothetical protein
VAAVGRLVVRAFFCRLGLGFCRATVAVIVAWEGRCTASVVRQKVLQNASVVEANHTVTLGTATRNASATYPTRKTWFGRR